MALVESSNVFIAQSLMLAVVHAEIKDVEHALNFSTR